MTRPERVFALAGILGVAGFVGAWSLSGAARSGYSATDDAISRLAQVGTPHRGWMTAGFVVFGLAIPLYARALRTVVAGPAWVAATVTGLSTVGVAAAPLGRADTAHYVFALIGYVSLVGTPFLAARTFRASGATIWAGWSVTAALGSAVFRSLSAIDRYHGLSQRVGLGFADVWIVGTAWSMVWRGALGGGAVDGALGCVFETRH